MLAESGEDAIAVSDSGDYAANVERAEALRVACARAAPRRSTLKKVPTPGKARSTTWRNS